MVTGEEPFNFFMTLFYPADSLLILDYNRVLKTLNGMSSEQFLDKLSEHFEITPFAKDADVRPPKLHSFSLHLDGAWY